MADGKINVDQLQALCVRSLLEEIPANALGWLAVDATPEELPEAQTSKDRGYIHVSNLPLADKPISIGWMFSVVGLLPEQASSWVPPLDIQRISSEQTAVGVAIDQLRQLKPLFGTRRVIVVADRWYGTPEMLRACQELGCSVLIRLKSNRKLYRQPVRRFKPGKLMRFIVFNSLNRVTSCTNLNRGIKNWWSDSLWLPIFVPTGTRW